MNDNLQLTEHNYYNTRASSHYGVPTFQRLTKSQKSLSFMVPQVWNSLPLDIRDSPSVTIFKRSLIAHIDCYDTSLTLFVYIVCN